MNKYYLTQEYIFKCIEKINYDEFAYDKFFQIDGDYLYRIWFIIGYKNDKIYFPFIGYEREKRDGIFYLHMGDDYIKKQYGDIYIRYNTLNDVYDFIKTLLNEFPKDITVPEDVVFKRCIIERNFENQETEIDIEDNSSYTDNVLINVKDKLCKYVNIKIGYETLSTINEDFNLEYFIKKIDKIINIDKYRYILDELETHNDSFDSSKLKIPLTGLALPWMNNDKLNQDYPILDKWL